MNAAGMAGKARLVSEGNDTVGFGSAWQARRVLERKARRVVSRQAGLGIAGPGMVRNGRLGAARRVTGWLGGSASGLAGWASARQGWDRQRFGWARRLVAGVA